MDGRKAGCLLVALVTVVCIQQAGVVLSVLGGGGRERKQVEKGTREPQEEIKTSDPDPRKFVTQMEIKLETQQRERTAG